MDRQTDLLAERRIDRLIHRLDVGRLIDVVRLAGTELVLGARSGRSVKRRPTLRLSLSVAGGRCYRVDMVALASGHLPPDESRGAYFGNPWHSDATTGVPRKAPVLVIGTGLTMVDTAQSLLDAGHKGTIYAFSRRGLMPHVHAPTHPLDIGVADLPRTTSVVRPTRWLRATVRVIEARGVGWCDVVDGLRPHLQDLWRRLPIEERRRFLRHLRPWWEIHRHRMAPSVAAQPAIRRGQLIVGTGSSPSRPARPQS